MNSKLKIVGETSKKTTDGHKICLCACECGDVSEYVASRVRFGKVNQCKECAKKATGLANTKHGMRNTKEYRAWTAIKERCLNVLGKDYHRYGAVGICVFGGWVDSFELFYAHIGRCPSRSMSIDRIDNSKGYIPGNVRWATATEQARNKRRSVYLTDGSKIMHIKDVADSLGISNGAAHLRLKRGRLHGYTRV